MEEQSMFKLLALTSCTATFEFCNDLAYENTLDYTVYLNGEAVIAKQKNNVFTLFGLNEGTSYEVKVILSDGTEDIQAFKTEAAWVTLNVKKFGAVGDGVKDDTCALQTAISACPEGSKVLIPEGMYLTGPLFLKSNITIELAKGSELIGHPDRKQYGILPGYIVSNDEKSELLLGTWEGNPLDMFASLITGIGVKNVNIVGEGVLNGNGEASDWWDYPRAKIGAYRPRVVFLNNCENVLLQGVTVKNSPCWTVHPYFSKAMRFIDMTIENDKHSPNTDGIDPESCDGVEIIGTTFSVGDDCIAIKAGKLYTGMTYQQPTQNMVIRNCLMQYGHGAVVIGSEMSGGVKNLTVEKCIFYKTDRGLRIKTRRGRGKYAVVENVTFRNIVMREVLTPFVINMFYFCDPDGKSEYVWSKEKHPVDDWTPRLGTFKFTDIVCDDCEYSAGYFTGLPEMPIDSIAFENVHIRFKEDAGCGMPAMMSYIEPVSKQGFYFYNVKNIEMKNTMIHNPDGSQYNIQGINEKITSDEVTKDGSN